MAKLTGVLADHQKRTERPFRFYPKEVGDQLVARMCAERISQNLIRMLPLDSLFPVIKANEIPGYIPPPSKHCDPIELPGIRFEHIPSSAWRREHRAEVFMAYELLTGGIETSEASL